MLIKKTEKDKNAIKNLDFNREIIKHKKFTVQLLELDIAYLYLHPNALMEVEDFVESLAAYHKLANGKRLKILVEFGEYTNVTTEAREFSQKNNPNALAEAIVIKSLSQRILSRFYLIFHHQNHQKRIFDNKDRALKWLQSI